MKDRQGTFREDFDIDYDSRYADKSAWNADGLVYVGCLCCFIHNKRVIRIKYAQCQKRLTYRGR